jgi:hypothetical protein
MGAGVFENSRSWPIPQHGFHRVRRIRIAIGRSAEWRPRAPVAQGPAGAALAIDGRLKRGKSLLAPNALLAAPHAVELEQSAIGRALLIVDQPAVQGRNREAQALGRNL